MPPIATSLWAFIDRVMTDIRDYHMPAFLIIFVTGGATAWFHHLDSTFVAFTGTVIGGITGHAIFSPTQQSSAQTGVGSPGEKG
jgi:intracellular septation protein A